MQRSKINFLLRKYCTKNKPKDGTKIAPDTPVSDLMKNKDGSIRRQGDWNPKWEKVTWGELLKAAGSDSVARTMKKLIGGNRFNK